MGGVDANDQLLQYSAFDGQNVKWWKCAFRLLNLAMVNAYILYVEYLKQKHPNKKKPTQDDFRVAVIKQLIKPCAGDNVDDTPRHINVIPTENKRLTGRHFLQKIPTPLGKKQSSCTCVVCAPKRQKTIVFSFSRG